MTTWAYPVHIHPWFRMPSLKRKGPDDENILSPDPGSQSAPLSRSKRRRCNVLEHGIAQLSLDPPDDGAADALKRSLSEAAARFTSIPTASIPEAPVVQSQPSWDTSMYTYPPTDAPSVPVVRPGSVEEPTSPVVDLPDVQMKSPSWYEIEKDRIVVTDLEDSDTEESESDASTKTTPDMTVSPALLERLSKHVSAMPTPRYQEPDSSKALVLFRPLVIPAGNSEIEGVGLAGSNGVREAEAEESSFPDASIASQSDDAMDIEPF
ncbi:hypothetical protein AcW1_009088 [Taiwanofungus camphoratus]|nr:hypothetical protein AcV5_007109 [Antrodia cinnamomea]KAI0949487.1 hypothetical protein AcW1_009088 [Antrodia cinnamomea]